MKATLVDGAFHDVDSSVLAFEIAGRGCTRQPLSLLRRVSLQHGSRLVKIVRRAQNQQRSHGDLCQRSRLALVEQLYAEASRKLQSFVAQLKWRSTSLAFWIRSDTKCVAGHTYRV